MGIDPAAELDPNDATAFMATLTFVDSGQFTGTMIPIKVFDADTNVPERDPLLLRVIRDESGTLLARLKLEG